MSEIANQKMVELAALQRKIDHGQSSTTIDLHHFQQALADFQDHDFITMSLAVMLLEGKSYSLAGDNPDTVSRCKSLAEHMGASVEEIREGGHLIQIVFRPASRQ